MDPWLRFVVASLAVWRVSFLLAREDGPWDLFAGLRRASGSGAIGKLLRCVKCLSVWISLPLAPWVVSGRGTRIVVWLALSGVASLIDEWTRPPFEWREGADDDLLRRDDDRSAQ